MPAAGGSATINGILFQLLGTLGHAAEVWLRPQVRRRQDLQSVLLTIEPAGGGGDLQLAIGPHRVVEQWKVRGGSRTWSLREVIEKVIPDLYLAVDEQAKAYRFRTNGRMGSWDAAYTFFRNLGEPPDDPSPALLDDSTQRRFARGVRLSERQLFQWVVDAVRSRREVAQEPTSQTHQKLWHLLSRFEMPPPVALADLASRIEKALEAHVERIEDVESKRHELCARIATLAAKGEVRLTPEDVLNEVGLSLASFLRWNDVRQRLLDRLQQRIEQAGYRSALDVRPPSQSVLDYPVTVFASGSGQGKTWQLASLALAAAEGPGLVAWVPSARRSEAADAVAADEIWKRGLGHDQRLDLEDVVERRARTNPNAPVPWATICIDDVRTPEEADYLTTLEWKRWGIRLALTCSPELARRLEHVWGPDAAVVEVTDFTHPQLRDYLQRRGRPWADTPPDVREVIRRPVLARIYGDLAETAQWTPRHEYELMDAYWGRIRQRGQPVDEAVLRDLGGQLLDAEPVYPWSPAALQTAGATPEILSRLEVAGWIQQNEDGDVELWHDRLLGWATAKAIVHRLRQHRMTQQQLEAFLTSLEKRDNPTLRRLVYLPMDLLWLTLDPDAPPVPQQVIPRILRVLDHESGYGVGAEHLYREALPTLGSRVAPALVEHLRQVDLQGNHPLPHLVASALRAVAEREPDQVTRQIDVCLNDCSPALQEVAVRLIPEMPTASALERVWELHRPLARKLSNDFRRRQLTSRAFSAAVAAAPARAVELLRRPESDEADLVTLMYAFAGAGGEDAAKVWHEHKRDWVQRVPAAQGRCIVNCILRFRDHDEIDRLEGLAASPEEIVGPWALVALALFDPARAVGRLHAPPPERLCGMERHLAQILLAFVPNEMLEEVRRLASQRPEAAPVYLQMLASGSDRLGAEAADALIEWADRGLEDYLSDPEHQDKHRLHKPLTALTHLHGVAALDRFRRHAGSGFEQRLTEAALRWADNTSGFVDHVLKDALQVLLKIGGEGLTRVVNAQLIAQSWQVRIEGCSWAPLQPNDQTRRLVGELARSEKVEGREDRPLPVVQQKAADALAAMGEDAALIRAILRWGTQLSPYLAELRQGQPPMPDGAIKPAVELLDRPQNESYPHAVLALGHSGRADYRARLQEIFKGSSPQSLVALCAALALARLGKCDDEVLPRAIERYRSGQHKFAVLQLLATRLPDEADDLVRQLLPASPPYDEMDQRLIVYMARQPSRRPLVESHLRHLTQGNANIGTSLLFERSWLLDPKHPDDQEELWRRVANRKGGVHIGGKQAGAIERLAAVEPDAAFEVAERVIRSQEGDWAKLPEVLLKGNAERAVPRLIAVAAGGASMHVCHEVALGLRRWGEMDHVRASLQTLLNDERWQVRRAGAYMAGFAGPSVLADALSRLVLKDAYDQVCTIAVEALRRQHREREAQRMIESLAGADLTRARAMVEAVVELVDPKLLTGSKDPLAFCKAMSNQPPVLHRQAVECIKKRRNQVKNDPTSSVGRDEDGW